jgi:hypothetical protein
MEAPMPILIYLAFMFVVLPIGWLLFFGLAYKLLSNPVIGFLFVVILIFLMLHGILSGGLMQQP